MSDIHEQDESAMFDEVFGEGAWTKPELVEKKAIWTSSEGFATRRQQREMARFNTIIAKHFPDDQSGAVKCQDAQRRFNRRA